MSLHQVYVPQDGTNIRIIFFDFRADHNMYYKLWYYSRPSMIRGWRDLRKISNYLSRVRIVEWFEISKGQNNNSNYWVMKKNFVPMI